MKILHTADWHIGKNLLKVPLDQDFLHFSEWLKSYLFEEKIDVLMVSGDIFDYANPSHQDLKTYYKLLIDIQKSGVQTIITGGNHDSPGLLNGPREILNSLNITVLGSFISDHPERHLVPVYKNNELMCIVLAVPYLREKDLRMSKSASENIFEQDNSAAVKAIYDELTLLAKKLYPENTPLLAMGHLHLYGSLTSDSEREIHIGNLNGLPSHIFNENIEYIALGHIHKPQKIKGLHPIYYSGSPIFLDFSEKDYSKQVILLELNKGEKIEIKTVPIPGLRKMIKIAGNIDMVMSKLKLLETKVEVLPTFVELEIEAGEDSYNDKKKVTEIVELYEDSTSLKILKTRIVNENLEYSMLHDDVLLKIEEMDPLQVFRHLLEVRSIQGDKKLKLEKAYVELLEGLLK
ncbi:MAG: exonuclease subunit SbcD [Saprospiraceae bacterium]|nr:exonuclease subunit SbcD [Saprospiraceae bacterium]MBK8370113.1 exonuclease subunit SbcD [Saprospiraceae bacterium]MBK8856018.1 exonuclease subunit SbcD [Saprospiraceae bacterium]MBP6694634.1 exonuclease subunit SbcD [Saprospiraceae bacterium]